MTEPTINVNLNGKQLEFLGIDSEDWQDLKTLLKEHNAKNFGELSAAIFNKRTSFLNSENDTESMAIDREFEKLVDRVS